MMKINFEFHLEFYQDGGFLLGIGKLTIWAIACIDQEAPDFNFGWFQVDWDETTILMLK